MDGILSRNTVQWKDFMSTVMNVGVHRKRQFRNQLDKYLSPVQRITSPSH
jgi:hypothetical protein